jgi:two-component system, NtrC family, response regulator AtoC
MISKPDSRPIIVFAESISVRDHWRAAFMRKNKRVLCFEQEAICFDNLAALDPMAIVLNTDSPALAWRFIFALHACKADARLLILSNAMDLSGFQLHGLPEAVHCFPVNLKNNGLYQTFWDTIDEVPNTSRKAPYDLLVGETAAIKSINAALPGLVDNGDPVLITGERGTGKELLARVIVESLNGDSIFIKIDCSCFKPEIVDQGHPFEQVVSDSSWLPSPGVAANATLTTIFLAKVDQLDDNAQAKLRFLLDEAWGLRRPRLIATSEADLNWLARRNRFRKDLFYRLNVIPLYLPPLRQRKPDIPILIDYFAIAACAKLNRSFLIPSEQTKSRLYAHQWPGNLDELRRAMYRLALYGDENQVFKQTGIPPEQSDAPERVSLAVEMEKLITPAEIKKLLPELGRMSLKTMRNRLVHRTEKRLMQKALECTHWNRKKAAGLLKISYKSMLNKIQIHEIV